MWLGVAINFALFICGKYRCVVNFMPNYTGIINNKDVAVKIFKMIPFYSKNPMINWINSSIGDYFFLVPKEIKIRKNISFDYHNKN